LPLLPGLPPRAAYELDSPREAWLLEGGVKGRNPPRFSAPADGVAIREPALP
jgi:hypothetical protein